MNYKIIYEKLIEKAKLRNTINEYTERHHIIPRCCGGNDDKENIAILTAKEHYVAHHLLLKIYKNTEYYPKLIYAFRFMTVGHEGKRLGSAYDYEYMRKLYSEHHPMYQPGIKEKMIKNLKKYYKNISDAERVYKSNKTSESWHKKTPEEKQAIIEKIKITNNSKSFAEVLIIRKKISDTIKNRTDEEKQAIREKTRKTRDAWSDEKKTEYRKKLTESQHRFWNSLTPEQREAHIKKLRAGDTPETHMKQSKSLKRYLATLTPEELSARQKHSFGSCDHKKRGEAISKGKKGKKTKQLEIMGNRFADMTDEEFTNYLSTKSKYVWTRYTNLRKKVLDERNKNENR